MAGVGTLVAPFRQRDEARTRLAELPAPEFPGGRIEVRDVGFFDLDNGTRLLLFAVKITNRELSRRMNLELDFVLRMFTAITKFNPDLKPLEIGLQEYARKRPPRPLGIDPQDSPPEFHYNLEWTLNSGITFDDDGLKFHPEQPEDEFILRVRDLQTGARLDLPIPGVWES